MLGNRRAILHDIFLGERLCAFNAFVSLLEPKNIKEAIVDPDWVTAMQ